MSNELVPFSMDNMPVVSDEEIGALENVASSSNYLQRVQLVTSGKYVNHGKCLPGRWVIAQGDDCTVLAESIDVLPIAVRNKATDMKDRSNVISNYDNTSDEFNRIKNAPKGSDCMWGQSYLVIERSTGEMFELFFGNASGRQESDKLKPFLPRANRQARPATLNIKFRTGGKHEYHVPVIVKCSEPFTSGPTVPEMVAAKEKFMNPPVDEVEVEEAETPSRPR